LKQWLKNIEQIAISGNINVVIHYMYKKVIKQSHLATRNSHLNERRFRDSMQRLASIILPLKLWCGKVRSSLSAVTKERLGVQNFYLGGDLIK
jgi:hypothetical protein